jgi:hypothetical protein
MRRLMRGVLYLLTIFTQWNNFRLFAANVGLLVIDEEEVPRNDGTRAVYGIMDLPCAFF